VDINVKQPKAICLHDRKEIESFLRRNVYLHIYAIGDLDDFFWPYTTWYAVKENEEIQAIAMLYSGRDFPVLLALMEGKPLEQLIQSVIDFLPGRFHAHLSQDAEAALEQKYEMESRGKYYKMALSDKSLLDNIDCSRVIRLKSEDLGEVLQLYKDAYPGNWFDSRMLQTGQYFGIRKDSRLVSVAGVHVYSQRYKAAALGNIVTHPDYRDNGFGKVVTARLCRSLSETVDHIGLNVKSANEVALSMYKKLGFEVVECYWEYDVQ
jgi:ribosomal protein S18 acetylase RimI-like enzyme